MPHKFKLHLGKGKKKSKQVPTSLKETLKKCNIQKAQPKQKKTERRIDDKPVEMNYKKKKKEKKVYYCLTQISAK